VITGWRLRPDTDGGLPVVAERVTDDRFALVAPPDLPDRLSMSTGPAVLATGYSDTRRMECDAPAAV
jgi:hypothetical protein